MASSSSCLTLFRLPSPPSPPSLPSLILIRDNTSYRFPLGYSFRAPLMARTRCSSGTRQQLPGNELSGEPRIMFAGGGTGGHIYPAIAIADEIKAMRPDACFRFVGTKSGMEWTATIAAGFEIVAIRTYSLKRPFFSPANLLLPLRLLTPMAESWRILDEFRPEIVVGTGGYVSFPVCFVAAIRGIKTVIQEQNSQPGAANWILSAFARRIFLAFPSCTRFFPAGKCSVTGNPVRPSLRAFISKAAARSHFFPRAKKSETTAQVVLVLGGSSGANAINMALLNMYSQMLLEKRNRYIIWQTGINSFDEMESLVKGHPRLSLVSFLDRMDLAYAAADLVVCRAGAMTCTEILTTGKPSILIPSPSVAEDHQTRNASIMSEIAGSKILDEEILDSTVLRDTIEEVLGNERLMTEMSEKALRSARPDASREIAEQILSLIGDSHTKSRQFK